MAEAVLADLKRRGDEVIAFGPLAGENMCRRAGVQEILDA